MADDKTADPSKPSAAGSGEPKAGAASAPSASGPSSSPTQVGAAAEPIDKPSTKPSSGSPAPTEADPATKKGSEWTASDDRGPLGRAEDEADGGAGTARPGSLKTAAANAPIARPATETSPAKPLAAAGNEKDPAKSKGTSVPPVDAPSTATRPVASGASQASATPKSAGKPEEPKRSLWPVAAALMLGAVIGAGSAAFVYRGYADDGQPDPKLADLTTRVDALEKRPDPQPAISALKTSVAALGTQVAAAHPGKGGAGAPPQPQSPSAAAAPPSADLDAMRQKLAALQAKFDEPNLSRNTKALEAKIDALQSEIDKTKGDATAAQASVAAVQGQQKEMAGRVMVPALAVVADSLVQQIDHGQPYVMQVDALATLGADPAKVAVLRENAAKGVPSARELEAKFEPLASPIIATATKAPANAGLGERLKSGMFSIVSIRRADDTSGDDLPSRVARIKTALDHDDVAAAYEAWSKLPPDAKAKAEAWGALAKTRVEAMDAARSLQQDAIAALGAKKS